MEILDNFSSIYCFITFIMGAVFMFVIFYIRAIIKEMKPKNNIHFYVARDKDGELNLYFTKPIRDGDKFTAKPISNASFIGDKSKDYDLANLKWEDEPVEVFINMED